MNMTIHATRGHDHVFTGDHFRGRAYDELRIHSLHRVRIAGFADSHDPAVLYSDVALHDAPMIQNHRVRDHQVQRAIRHFAQSSTALRHAIADHFAAAESDLVAVVREIFLDFHDQLGVRLANAV